jgi:hypothetical protein
MEIHKHTIDLRKFLSEQSAIISDYISRSSNSISELANDKNFINEEILKLIVRWSTGITTTIIQQDVIKKAGSIKKGRKVKADQAFITPTIHATITSIGEYTDEQGRRAYTLTLEQRENEHRLQFAVHGALVGFIGRCITPGHRIHIANARFLNDIIIPTQLVIIDLKKTFSEVDFICECTKRASLKDIAIDKPIPEALLLRIENANHAGVLVTDGSTQEPFVLLLDEERKGLKLLLRFKDVIMLYRPDVVQADTGFLLRFGPETVVFRVPATGDKTTSQFTQKASTLSQDGLLIRNSNACRSVDGHVVKIEHEKTVSTITLITSDNKTIQLNSNSNEIPSTLMSNILLIRKNHYIWAFGLSAHDGADFISFNDESTLFNTSLMHGIIASSFVPKYSLKRIDDFNTFLTRAVIVSVDCECKNMHKVCRTISPDDKHCSYCRSLEANELKRVLIVRFLIDDGTCDPVEVATTHEKLPFWGVSPMRWCDASDQQREKMKRKLLGQQFIFALSSAEETEFGNFTDSKIMRVDMAMAPVGDAHTHICEMRKWFERNEQ